MKRLLVLTLLMSLIASAAFADHVGIYSDDSGSSCNLTPAPPYSETTAVIHKFTAGATGSRFRIDTSASTGASVIGFIAKNPFLPIGSASSDLQLAYGTCLSGSIVVGHLQIIWLGGTAGGTISVAKPQGFPAVLYFDCASPCCTNEKPATGGYATVNGNGLTCGEPTPTEPSTWGSVKSLYR